VRDLPAGAGPQAAPVTRRQPAARSGPAACDPVGGIPLPPAWGWKLPQAGRAAHVDASPEVQATTVQACGLYPFIAGAGAPLAGTPVGRHQLGGEVVCLDPLAWVRGGLTTNPGMFLLGQPGAGKALSLDTPVPVPAGWTAMGDLRVGDYVFDDAGRPVPVMAVSEVMTGRTCLEIRFDEAAAIIADADHQWVTVAAAAAVTAGNGPRDAGPGGTAIRTTRQIMDTLTGSGGEPAHSVSAAGPLQLPGVYLPVPPWLLGCWLAGGADSEGRLTVLRDRLTELGLLPGPPHIPRRYLRAA